MPRTSFLDTPEDCQWLRDTALKGVPLPAEWAEFKAAILQGNEDAPHAVNLYKESDPNTNDDFFRVRFVNDGLTYAVGVEWDGKTDTPKGGLAPNY